MATLFLSYQSNDLELAKMIQKALEEKGHDLRLDVTGLEAADDWRRVLMDELAASDAIVVLLTDNALRSNFVMAEIGAARVFSQTRGMYLIPVIVGNLPVPPIIGDLWAVRLSGNSPQGISEVANAIDRSLKKHIEGRRGTYPPIFISHRHKDEDVVKALVRLLESTFYIETGDIRCTSIEPYRLPVGERTAERLRAEISRAKVVLGILTPETKESSYILFELGSSWGQKIPTLPLLAKGATAADIPAPIGDLHFLQLTDERDCYRLIYDLPKIAGLRSRDGAGPRTAEGVRDLVQRAQEDESAGAEKGDGGKTSAEVTARPKPSAKKSADAAAKDKLRSLLADPKYSAGRYLHTLCAKTELSENKCRKLLLEIGAREVELEKGEGWTLRARR